MCFRLHCFVLFWTLLLICSPPFTFTFMQKATRTTFIFRSRCFSQNAKACRKFAAEFKDSLNLHFIGELRVNYNHRASLSRMGALQPQFFTMEKGLQPIQVPLPKSLPRTLNLKNKNTLPPSFTKLIYREDPRLEHCNFEIVLTAWHKGIINKRKGYFTSHPAPAQEHKIFQIILSWLQVEFQGNICSFLL